METETLLEQLLVSNDPNLWLMGSDWFLERDQPQEASFWSWRANKQLFPCIISHGCYWMNTGFHGFPRFESETSPNKAVIKSKKIWKKLCKNNKELSSIVVALWYPSVKEAVLALRKVYFEFINKKR